MAPPKPVKFTQSKLTFFKRKTEDDVDVEVKRARAESTALSVATDHSSVPESSSTKLDVATGKPSLLSADGSPLTCPFTTPFSAATTSTPTRGFQPFAKKTSYTCPYFAAGKACSHAKPHFTSFRGLCAHVRDMHKRHGLLTTVEQSPFMDGTQKIPCRKECEEMFTSYQQAVQHGRRPGCLGRKLEHVQIPCPFQPYLPCSHPPLTNLDALANHTRSHVKDPRAPYLCSKNCGEHHANLYTLAAHEEKCKGAGATVRYTTLRILLTESAKTETPAIILLARSSSEPPESWYAHKGDWRESLWFWGRRILEHFVAYSGIHGPAVLHAASDTQTRYLPAPELDDSSALQGQARWESHRAFKFTEAWTEEMKAANAAGIVPTVLSVGLDAWACDVRKILPWLQTRTVQFHLHMRLNGLMYGMTDLHVTLHHNVYWAQYDVATILAALENGPGDDASVAELLNAWKDLQDHKDFSCQVDRIRNGRNNVDWKVTFPALD